MRLENLLSLVGGDLRSSPAVAQFEAIVLKPHRVRRGDIFVAYDPREIPQALANGAYAVLFEEETPVTDAEAAWIRVASLDDALLRLLRFHLLERSLIAVACDSVTLALAAQMVRDERACIVEGSVREELHRLWELPEGSRVFFEDLPRWHDVFIDAVTIPHTDREIVVMEQTLFETSFILDGEYYERQMISPFFLPRLNRLVAWLKSNGLHYRITGMQGTSHFEPVFVGDDLRVKPFGHGSKVLIFEKDPTLVPQEIAFIGSEAKWAKTLCFVPEEHRDRFPENRSILPYASRQDIINLLKTEPFHFALIGGQDKSLLDETAAERKLHTLF